MTDDIKIRNYPESTLNPVIDELSRNRMRQTNNTNPDSRNTE